MSFCVWFISLRIMFSEVHPYCSMCQNFTLWMDTILLYVYTVGPRCLQILYLWSAFWPHFLVTPKSMLAALSGCLQTCTSCDKLKWPPECTFQLRLFLLVSALVLQTGVLFLVYFVPHFCIVCAFCWWFHSLKWSPTLVLKCCVVFLGARRLRCTLRKHTGVR